MTPNRDDIQKASRRLEGRVVYSSVQAMVTDQSQTATLKLESTQRSGSFKARGAMNAMLSTRIGSEGVVAASGGNHGAAVAWAARELGHTANIFVPELISPSKLDKLEEYGANIHLGGREFHEAFAAAQTFKQHHDCTELHAYDQNEVVAGAGTIAIEIAQVPDATTIFVSCGGGGLAAGLAIWWGTSKRLVVVETEGTQAWAKARKAGRPVDVEVTGIAADSLGARRIGNIGWLALTSCEAESSIVTDEQVAAAQQELMDQHGVVAEPAAAASFAGFKSVALAQNEKCVLVICGANST